MNAFHLLKQGQQRLQQKRAKQRHQYQHCPKSFSNARSLAQHLKVHPVFKKDEKLPPKIPLFKVFEEKKSQTSYSSKRSNPPTIAQGRKKKVAKKGVLTL